MFRIIIGYYAVFSPLFGESFSFHVPRPFSCLKFYVCDGDGVVRDPRIGHVTFTRDQLALLHEFTSEQWYPVYALTADTEVQVYIAME